MNKEFKSVYVEPGQGGWGEGLEIHPTEEKNKVISVTGGGIHPVAKTIAELTGAEAVDGFKNSVPDNEVACAVIDCGGTARIGVYPMKGILTVDILASKPSGPLAKNINEDNFVSGVKPENVKLINNEVSNTEPVVNIESNSIQDTEKNSEEESFSSKYKAAKEEHHQNQESSENFISRMSRGIGKGVGVLYQAGKDAVETTIKSIIPFMAFVSVLVGIINYTGLGRLIASLLEPLSGSIIGFLIISIICALPFLSPILGPAGVIAQVIGVLIGSQIGMGSIPINYSLPALFAINSQAGCDFIPVGLSLAEADPETVEIGVPAVLYSRLITGPLAVIIAWLLSFGMY